MPVVSGGLSRVSFTFLFFHSYPVLDHFPVYHLLLLGLVLAVLTVIVLQKDSFPSTIFFSCIVALNSYAHEGLTCLIHITYKIIHQPCNISFLHLIILETVMFVLIICMQVNHMKWF